jgi:hypothetical protein
VAKVRIRSDGLRKLAPERRGRLDAGRGDRLVSTLLQSAKLKVSIQSIDVVVGRHGNNSAQSSNLTPRKWTQFLR